MMWKLCEILYWYRNRAQGLSGSHIEVLKNKAKTNYSGLYRQAHGNQPCAYFWGSIA